MSLIKQQQLLAIGAVCIATREINGIYPTSMKGTGSYDKNPVHPKRKQPQRNKKMRQNMHDQTTKTNLSLKTDPSNMILLMAFLNTSFNNRYG